MREWIMAEGTGHYYFILFPAALGILFILMRGRRLRFLVPSLVISLVILNPLFYKIWDRMGLYAYWRILWVVPVVPVLAAVAPAISERMKNGKWRTAAVCLCLGTLALAGSWLYAGPGGTFTVPAENMEKVPGYVAQIADKLLSLKECPRVIVQDPIGVYIRQYTGEIDTLFGRDIHGYIRRPSAAAKTAYQAIEDNELDIAAQIMVEEGYDYLVVRKDLDTTGLEMVAEVDEYGIYQAAGNEAPRLTWRLTQYVDVSGNQGMFYSLKKGKTVILVDSGWAVNAEQVRNVIDRMGGHVTAWFLTHYHPDHIGAFNEVYEEYRDQIDRIYVTPIDWETYEPRARAWDDAGTYARFLEITQGAENIQALHRGDELEIDGLRVQVFNAFDEYVQELSKDWLNDCSLVLKFSSTEKSVLFLGDLSRTGVPLGQYLLDTYGAEALHADYVQGGHHGNWGQPIAFYEAIQPGELFFDAPESIMTGEKYDAKDLEAWCREQGIPTHDYRQGGLTVKLE